MLLTLLKEGQQATIRYRDDDEGDVIRDGETLRVRMTMMDTARRRQLINDGTDDPLALHKPGFRIDASATRLTSGSATASARQSTTNTI